MRRSSKVLGVLAICLLVVMTVGVPVSLNASPAGCAYCYAWAMNCLMNPDIVEYCMYWWDQCNIWYCAFAI